MLGRIFVILFFIALTALQSTLSPAIAVFGVKPDILLIAVVVWAMVRGPREGGAVGAFSGLLEDVLATGLYIHIVTKAATGVIAGFVGRNLGSSAGSIYVVTVAALTPICYALEIITFYFFFGRELPSFYSVGLVMLLSSLYNAALTLILYVPLSRFLDFIAFGEKTPMKEYRLYRM